MTDSVTGSMVLVSAFRKLGVTNRAEARTAAQQRGLVADIELAGAARARH